MRRLAPLIAAALVLAPWAAQAAPAHASHGSRPPPPLQIRVPAEEAWMANAAGVMSQANLVIQTQERVILELSATLVEASELGPRIDPSQLATAVADLRRQQAQVEAQAKALSPVLPLPKGAEQLQNARDLRARVEHARALAKDLVAHGSVLVEPLLVRLAAIGGASEADLTQLRRDGLGLHAKAIVMENELLEAQRAGAPPFDSDEIDCMTESNLAAKELLELLSDPSRDRAAVAASISAHSDRVVAGADRIKRDADSFAADPRWRALRGTRLAAALPQAADLLREGAEVERQIAGVLKAVSSQLADPKADLASVEAIFARVNPLVERRVALQEQRRRLLMS